VLVVGDEDTRAYDGAADVRAATDTTAVEEDAVFDFGAGLDDAARADDAANDGATADHAAVGEQGVYGLALVSIAGIRRDFGRRKPGRDRADRPARIVQVERRLRRAEIHLRRIVRLEVGRVVPVEARADTPWLGDVVDQ